MIVKGEAADHMLIEIRISVQIVVTGKSNTAQDGGIVIDSEGFVQIFNLFMDLYLF